MSLKTDRHDACPDFLIVCREAEPVFVTRRYRLVFQQYFWNKESAVRINAPFC